MVLAIAAIIATRPAGYEVSRSATMPAPVEAVFPLVADLHQWPAWSPREMDDPAVRHRFEGPESGLGAVATWKGNEKVGEGKLTITGLVANESERVGHHPARARRAASLRPADRASLRARGPEDQGHLDDAGRKRLFRQG
ncbi:MAG: SRPBCC family protein [Myxococcales bacterium]|nr:SRPBCC family protein [Myxococcales bacterium]